MRLDTPIDVGFDRVGWIFPFVLQQILRVRIWFSAHGTCGSCLLGLALLTKLSQVTTNEIDCSECAQPMRDDMERCPHCCRPSIFPNVNVAKRSEEVAELDLRYSKAVRVAQSENRESDLSNYETAVADSRL